MLLFKMAKRPRKPFPHQNCLVCFWFLLFFFLEWREWKGKDLLGISFFFDFSLITKL